MLQISTHYIADRFYSDGAAIGGLRRESDRIVAQEDAQAIEKAAPLGQNPFYWQVRKVRHGGDNGAYSKIIYDSRRERPHA